LTGIKDLVAPILPVRCHSSPLAQHRFAEINLRPSRLQSRPVPGNGDIPYRRRVPKGESSALSAAQSSRPRRSASHGHFHSRKVFFTAIS